MTCCRPRRSAIRPTSRPWSRGVVTGDLIELPAGPLGVAVGAEWRNFEIDDTPDPRSVNNEFWGTTSAGNTRGEDTVSEVYAEVNIPAAEGPSLHRGTDHRWFGPCFRL